MNDITHLLSLVGEGSTDAADALFRLIYAELRQTALRKLAKETPSQSLDATALVHEAYLRLVDNERQPAWENRRHFFAAAAEAMRRILVERARRRKTYKHGGHLQRHSLNAADFKLAEMEKQNVDLLALDEALEHLAEKHPKKAELVKLRFFAGMTTQEASEQLGISVSKAERNWDFAKTWLHREIRKGDSTAT